MSAATTETVENHQRRRCTCVKMAMMFGGKSWCTAAVAPLTGVDEAGTIVTNMLLECR